MWAPQNPLPSHHVILLPCAVDPRGSNTFSSGTVRFLSTVDCGRAVRSPLGLFWQLWHHYLAVSTLRAIRAWRENESVNSLWLRNTWRAVGWGHGAPPPGAIGGTCRSRAEERGFWRRVLVAALLFMNKVGQWGVEETETRRRRRKRTREGYQKPKKREQMLYSFINGI